MKHLLVIDDDPVVLALSQDYLEEAGYRVSIAPDAICSNSIIYGSDPPDLILIDEKMPLMSGPHKILAMKLRDASRNIPVLLLSEKKEAELQLLVRDVDATGCLTKPFKATALVSAVGACLPGRTG